MIKKLLALLLCAAVLSLFVSCGEKSNATLDEVLAEISPEDYASSDLGADGSDLSSSDVSGEVTVTVKDAVKTEYQKSGSYTYSGTKIAYSYKYPQITLSGVNVSEINDDIKSYCQALIDVELSAMNSGRKIGMTDMNYTACVKGEALSLLISSQFGSEYTLYETVNINITTGSELSKNDILNAAGLTSKDGDAKIKAAAESKFTQVHGTVSDRSTDEMIDYEKAKSATSLDYDSDLQLYFAENGSLKAIVRIYKLGGNDYEYYEVSVK